MIKIKDKRQITKYLINKSILILIECDKDIESFVDVKYWVYRVLKEYPTTYNGLFLDATIVDYDYSIDGIARSLSENISLGHSLYVVTEEELSTLKMLRELVN